MVRSLALLQLLAGVDAAQRSTRSRNRRCHRESRQARPGCRDRRQRRRKSRRKCVIRCFAASRSRADPAVLRQRLRALQRHLSRFRGEPLPAAGPRRSSFTRSRSTRRVSFEGAAGRDLRRPTCRALFADRELDLVAAVGRSSDALHPLPSHECSSRPCRSSIWAPISAWSCLRCSAPWKPPRRWPTTSRGK